MDILGFLWYAEYLELNKCYVLWQADKQANKQRKNQLNII